MSQKKYKTEKLIRVPNAIHILRVSPQLFKLWFEEGKFNVKTNKNGKPCITETDLKKLAHSDFVQKASSDVLLNHLERLKDDQITGGNLSFERAIKENVSKYKSYIKTLEQIHSNYHDRVDLIDAESALLAAYILHARIIHLLNMACLSLENHYWYTSLLLRPIDETIDLAVYFIVTENTDIGKKHLTAWFKENKSPSHFICRKAISKYISTFLGDDANEIHEETMTDLYNVKSKPVHPTYNEILLVLFKPEIRNREIISLGFDYDRCSNLRELYSFSTFFQSSIWTTVQGFLICFQETLPLIDSDREELLSLNEKFENECDKVFI